MSAGFGQEKKKEKIYDNKKPPRNENQRWTPSSNGINLKKLLKNRRSNCHRTN